jgi:shikimate dehydrogenase
VRQFFAIIGHPVSHSLSPLFQQAAFDEAGIEAAYLPFDIPPEALTPGLSALRTLNVSGFNITLPHKETMIRETDRVSETAREIGAVNTVISQRGEWIGDNTDGPGFLQALERFLEENRLPFPSRVLIFGAGGSARAVLWALARRRVGGVCLVNRTLKKASQLLEGPLPAMIPDRHPCALDDPSWKDWLRESPAPLLVNTLSLHAFPDGHPPFPPLSGISLSGIPLFDLSYAAWGADKGAFDGKTPFLRMGDPTKSPRQNGLGMLLCQGALAFELWTGKKAPIERMEEVLRRATGQKSLWKSL